MPGGRAWGTDQSIIFDSLGLKKEKNYPGATAGAQIDSVSGRQIMIFS
jgi:hypothetical protein